MPASSDSNGTDQVMYVLVEIRGSSENALRRGNRVVRMALHQVTEEWSVLGGGFTAADIPVWNRPPRADSVPPDAFPILRDLFGRARALWPTTKSD